MSTGRYPYDGFVPGDGDDTPEETGRKHQENIDEFIERLKRDEVEDQPLISPVDYSKIRPITAQLVYYRIRSGKIKTQVCNCGRTCINKKEADEFFRKVRGAQAWPYGADAESGSDDEET